MAELFPQGTLGIRRFSATLSAGQTYTLEGCQRGLYIYQDISASHVIGASLIQADGSCSEIVSIPYIKPKETAGVLYFKKESTSSPVAIHNGYSNLQGIVITYIALS